MVFPYNCNTFTSRKILAQVVVFINSNNIFKFMKFKKFLWALTLGVMFCSCSSDEIEEVSNANSRTVTRMNLLQVAEIPYSEEENVLSFVSLEEFQQAVEEIERKAFVYSEQDGYIPMQEDRLALQISGFKSIYDVYEEALNEADNYYDSENHYAEFKAKYPSLYFPEYQDDYSAYLPVSNKYVAKLLNVNGEVKIGGKIVNMKDVYSYEKLAELGETLQDDITPFDYAGNYLNGTPELKNQGDRKLKVKVYTEPGTSGVYEAIVVDVSFRKKGAFGAWYNYRSKTTLGWVNGESWSKDGFSSHDYKFARKFQGGRPVPFAGPMYVDYQGFRGERVFFNVNI